MLDTVSNARPAIIRAQEGTTTGISAFDRAATFRALASPTTVPGDFNRPGHVFPLRPREGGVLERDGHTEASVDFCKLAGLHECGVLSEICNEDGSMSRVPEVRAAPALNPTPLPPPFHPRSPTPSHASTHPRSRPWAQPSPPPLLRSCAPSARSMASYSPRSTTSESTSRPCPSRR